MNILLCHNYYQQRGGEDQSFEDEASLLESHGHRVTRFTIHNDVIKSQSKLQTTTNLFWNGKAKSEVQALIQSTNADIVHCTNLFSQLSPSLYYAAAAENVPVVQSLRNYRLMCPAYSFHRDGAICEKCAGKSFAWPAISHACYRGSRIGTAMVAASFTLHRLLGSWAKKVSLFYTLTQFARDKFIQYGFPPERIVVKQNFISHSSSVGEGKGNYAVFVGRLSEEKGLATLLQAWQKLSLPLELRIIGDGPLRPQVESAAADDRRIEWLGQIPLEKVLEVVGDARFLICPSNWYETFGRVIAEAYSVGTPVIASDLGAMAELVEDGVTGAKFTARDSSALANAVNRMAANPFQLQQMRVNARAAFEERFTPETNYDLIMQIYEQAVQNLAWCRTGKSATLESNPEPASD